MVTKVSTQFECQECGYIAVRWQGQCDGCSGWNSFIEVTVNKAKKIDIIDSEVSDAIPISKILLDKAVRIPIGIPEFDRVLGGGLVRGGLTVLGGEPGIGKSTISLQIAHRLVKASGMKVLYISAEESLSQIKLRSERLGDLNSDLLVVSHHCMVTLINIMDKIKPDCIILDSIQVVFHSQVSAIEGSVSQVRYCANSFNKWIKKNNSIGILIGHITKDGNLAGPKLLEHMVDTILYLEGERNQGYRLLRSYKNRFYSTQDIGVFKMTQAGLKDVVNVSELFIDNDTLESSGSIVSAICDGNRVFLVEVQALVVDSGYGMAKRSFVGVNANRANLIIATIEKILKISLSGKDIFLNIIGGMRVFEPALDLAIVFAIISSLKEKPLSLRMGVIGEVGLTGEVRAVPNMKQRLVELEKMNFSGCFFSDKIDEMVIKNSLSYYKVGHISKVLDIF